MNENEGLRERERKREKEREGKKDDGRKIENEKKRLREVD